ncbi:MAG: ArsR/SmtB family transcription factor [Actinomycetota bacterium]
MGDDLVFKALADPRRRDLLDRLAERGGQTLAELCVYLPGLTRFGVMRHLRLLEEAGLIVARKVGREKHHFLNAVPIRQIHDRWLSRYAMSWSRALIDLKTELEATSTTARRVRKGKPMDTSGLENAYDELLAIARAGGFRDPPGGEWPAEVLLAHVATNDHLLAAVTKALANGLEPSYDNAPTQARHDLEHFANAAGGVEGLIPIVQEAGLELIRSAALLDAKAAEQVVSMRILDGTEFALDGPVPWGKALEIHAKVHLPAHIAQLAALREPAPVKA